MEEPTLASEFKKDVSTLGKEVRQANRAGVLGTDCWFMRKGAKSKKRSAWSGMIVVESYFLDCLCRGCCGHVVFESFEERARGNEAELSGSSICINSLETGTPFWYPEQNLLKSHRILHLEESHLWTISKKCSFSQGTFRMHMGGRFWRTRLFSRTWSC